MRLFFPSIQVLLLAPNYRQLNPFIFIPSKHYQTLPERQCLSRPIQLLRMMTKCIHSQYLEAKVRTIILKKVIKDLAGMIHSCKEQFE